VSGLIPPDSGEDWVHGGRQRSASRSNGSEKLTDGRIEGEDPREMDLQVFMRQPPEKKAQPLFILRIWSEQRQRLLQAG
jgi:hypothetical protein